MRLFLTEDGLTGFAIKGDDLVSVFKHPASEARGVAIPLARMAVWLGARRLDAYDTVLPYLYSTAGFKVASRVKWSDEAASDNWDKTEFSAFNNGEPDVVFMYHDPARSDFYTKGEGEYFDQYDDAVAAQSSKAGNVQYSGRRRSVAVAAALAASPVNANIADTPIAENSAIYKSLENGNAKQALAWLRQNSKSEDTRRIASILVKNGVGEQKTVILDPVNDLDSTIATLEKNGADQESIDLISMGSVRGMVLSTAKDKNIYLIKNPDQGANGVNEQTFLHEAIHAYVKARWSSVGAYTENNREVLDNRGLYNEEVAAEVQKFNNMWRGFGNVIKKEYEVAQASLAPSLARQSRRTKRLPIS